MLAKAWLQIIVIVLGLGVALLARAADTATLDAPASVPAGAEILVKWTGPGRQWDRIGVVRVGAPDGESPDTPWSTYATGDRVSITAPEAPGEYEVRYLGRNPRALLARRKITSSPVTASLEVPTGAISGSEIYVKWTGPANKWDRLYIVKAGAPEKTKTGVSTPASANPARLTVPEAPGEYEVRYVTPKLALTLARAPLTVSATTATLEAPATALAGAAIEVKWTGPANRYDRIYIVKAGSPEQARSDFSTPAGKSPARVTVPEALGEYEIRYETGGTHTTLAKAPLTVTSVTASLDAPESVTAGSYYKINWTGPGNEYDYVATFPKGSAADQYVAAIRISRSPAQLRAPLAPGEYELRYQTGQTGTTLATADLRVTPAKQEPGSVRVSAAHQGVSSSGAVEVILDASGSMLQKIGSERRIDIAKRTLKNLTGKVIPAGTPFALRVFGREANSCQTDLDIPPRPLDPAAVAGKIDELSAKSNAKTPIGASLEKVASDLKEVRGERLVILVTDGEETCGGNPAQSIQKLMQQGIDVRVNIVGFAVDDRKTAALFRQWASAGGGGYFDAQNAASLDEAFSLAVKPRFEIVDVQKRVVAEGLVGGDPVKVLPGKYTVRIEGTQGRSQTATVVPNATTNVDL